MVTQILSWNYAMIVRFLIIALVFLWTHVEQIHSILVMFNPFNANLNSR